MEKRQVQFEVLKPKMSVAQRFIVFSPLATGVLAIALMVLLYLYLFVFGTLLGLNVSSLDDDGPQWPFAAMWYLGWAALIGIPVGVIWAVVSTTTITRRER